MMQPIFRIILVLVSWLTMWFMLRKIRQEKVQIEAAMFWVIVALILVVFSLFPSAADACARLLGIYSTPNFLFLLMIFLLMAKVFSLTLQVSQMESKQKELVQKIALAKKDQEELEVRMQEMFEEGAAEREGVNEGTAERDSVNEGTAERDGVNKGTAREEENGR